MALAFLGLAGTNSADEKKGKKGRRKKERMRGRERRRGEGIFTALKGENNEPGFSTYAKLKFYCMVGCKLSQKYLEISIHPFLEKIFFIVLHTTF